MKREIIGQGAAVVLVVAIIAAIVGGAIVYVVKPTPVPPEIAELQAQISDLEGTVSTQESRISELESELAAIPPKPGEGIKIAHISHWSGEKMYDAVIRGAELASDLIGCEFEAYVVPADYPAQASMITTLVATGFDGIITTIPDDTAFDTAIQQAVDQGVIVIGCFNDDLTPNARQGFVGMPEYGEMGYTYGSYIFDVVPDGGKVLCPAESWAEVGKEDMGDGIIKYFTEHGKPNITFDKIETTYDVGVAETRIKSYLIANPDCDAIACLGGIVSEGSALAELALESIHPGDCPMMAITIEEGVIRAIKEGYCIGAWNFQPSLYGFHPVMQIYLAIKWGIEPTTMNPEIQLIDNSNLDEFLARAEQGVF